jgi:dihydrofolate reductase
MGKVTAALSVSLDGFIDGPNGEDGGLHAWVFSGSVPVEAAGISFKLASESSAELFREFVDDTGAIVIGRKAATIASEVEPIFNLPTFVLTHQPREPTTKDGVTVTFVNGGIENALEQARQAAGGKDVCIFGGADTVRQYLQAGLLDELQLDIVPVLLGGGTRLFDGASLSEVKLKPVRAVESTNVTHLIYRVMK